MRDKGGGGDLFDIDGKRPRKPFALVVPNEIFEVCICEPRIFWGWRAEGLTQPESLSFIGPTHPSYRGGTQSEIFLRRGGLNPSL